MPTRCFSKRGGPQLLVSAACDTFFETYRGLCERLRGSDHFVASNFGIANYLAVATVAMHSRPAGRLAIPPAQATEFIQAAQAMGVHCCLGRVRMVSVPDAIPETRHAALFVKDERPSAMNIIYFGVSPAIAEGVEEVELYGNHRLLGELFGYPDCCTEFFIKSEGAGPDRLPATIHSVGPFERLMNPITTYVYATPNLLFHFPCSPACHASIELAKRHRLFFSRIDPRVAATESLGRGIALYGQEVGIGLATEFEVKDESTFRLLRVITRSQMTHKLFAMRNDATIRFDSPNLFEIDGRQYSRSDQFGALFV